MKTLTRKQLDSITQEDIDRMRYMKHEIFPVVNELEITELGTIVMSCNGKKTKHISINKDQAMEIYKILARRRE